MTGVQTCALPISVFKEAWESGSPGDGSVQIHLNASLFKQGAEPAAMARGNLELATVSAFDIAKVVPEFSIFTAGYVVRDPAIPGREYNINKRLADGQIIPWEPSVDDIMANDWADTVRID